MADLNKINAVKNGNIAFAATAAASTQTIPITKDEKMAIYVNNASASAVTATVVKGNGICSVVGDLAVMVPASSAMLIGPLESARFVDTTTGKYTLNLSATSSVTVAVIQL